MARKGSLWAQKRSIQSSSIQYEVVGGGDCSSGIDETAGLGWLTPLSVAQQGGAESGPSYSCACLAS